MELPVYVTVEEVQRVCKALNIRDWTKEMDGRVLPEEAGVILKEVNVEGMSIPLADFIVGLEVELEHGTCFKDANVTNNHPLLTGKIVLAHLKETMDYYQRLDVAELEGDLLNAMVAKDLTKAADKYRKLLKAKLALAQAEARELGKEQGRGARGIFCISWKWSASAAPPGFRRPVSRGPGSPGRTGSGRGHQVRQLLAGSRGKAPGRPVRAEVPPGCRSPRVAVHPGRGGRAYQSFPRGVDGAKLGQQVGNLPEIVFLMVLLGQVEGAGRENLGSDRTF